MLLSILHKHPDRGLITLLWELGFSKTTLFNVLGGLDRFDLGEIEYDDYKIAKYKMSKMDKFKKRWKMHLVVINNNELQLHVH